MGVENPPERTPEEEEIENTRKELSQLEEELKMAEKRLDKK
ncbi:hypothetical protein [Candidatus Absconditicoccus praedator]|nr:hypothetical protein [Candidatus Absconditicoccus praedator]